VLSNLVWCAARLQKNHTLVFPRDDFLPTLPIRTHDQTPDVRLANDIHTEKDDASDTTSIARNTDKSTDTGDRPKPPKSSRKHYRRTGRPRTRSRYDLRNRSDRFKATRLANLVNISGPKNEFLESMKFAVRIFLPPNQLSLRINHI
jgi:hypothetical protein